jgi:hypothetical protein
MFEDHRLQFKKSASSNQSADDLRAEVLLLVLLQGEEKGPFFWGL